MAHFVHFPIPSTDRFLLIVLELTVTILLSSWRVRMYASMSTAVIALASQSKT